MRFPATCGVLMSAILCGHAALGAGASPADCKLLKAADLEVRVLPDGTVLVPARVADKDVWFVAATVGAYPLVTESGARLLGLQAKPISSRTETGSRTRPAEIGYSGRVQKQVTLRPFLLGQLSMTGAAALLVADPSGVPSEFEGKPMVGRLGTNLFRMVDVELDLANERVRLFKATDCAQPVYWGGEVTSTRMRFDRNGAMYFTMELEGQNISTSLMSGRNPAALDESIARQYFGFDSPRPASAEESAEGRFVAMSLSAAGLNVRNARVELSPSVVQQCGATIAASEDHSIQYAECTNVVPFSLGLAVLKKLRVYASAKQEMLYFTAAAAPPTP